MQKDEQTTVAPAPAKPAKKGSGLTDADKRQITKAVYTQETGIMNPIEYEQMRKISNDFWQAGALPASYANPEQVFMAMQMGRQMGMSPHEAIMNGYYVDGRYNVYGKAIPAALRRHGFRWRFTNETNEEVTIKIWPANDPDDIIEDTFTFQEAVDSGFTVSNYGKEKFGWKQGSNRKRKLRYAVMSQIVHTYFPEVLGPAAGIAEYSEDYTEGQTIQAEEAKTEKTKKQADIARKISSMKGAKLEDVKPRAVVIDQDPEA